VLLEREGIFQVTLSIRFKRVSAIDVPLPSYQTPGAAGFDLCAAISESVTIAPGTRRLIPTGFAIAIPKGYEGQVRPRSGLALKHGLSIVNSPGTIDSDYRGEVAIVLINHGNEAVEVKPLSRIAQMVIARVEQPNLELVDELDETTRGAGGYGSTGV
jgi:dUTP pyrophosphatase